MPILKKIALLGALALVATMGLTTFAQAEHYDSLAEAQAAAEKANKPLLLQHYNRLAKLMSVFI